MSIQQISQAHNKSGSLPANARLESMVNQKSADFSQRMNTYFKKTNTYFIRFFLFKPTNHNLQSMTVKKVWNTKYLTLMRADSGRAVMRARSRRAYARRLLARMHSWPPARKSWARCKLQTHQPQLTEYEVKKLWNTKYLTLMRADSGRTVMRARSQRAYARRLLARMHSWPPARKSWARCKLQTHQPQLTEYDCEESLEQKVSYTHARRFGVRCHARKVTARICA